MIRGRVAAGVASLALLMGCSSARPNALAGATVHDGRDLRVPAESVVYAKPSDLVAGYETSCSGGCDRVFVDVDVDGNLRPGALAASAASAAPTTPAVFLLAESLPPIEVIDSPLAECATVVRLEPDGAYVFATPPVEPDPVCGVWTAHLCRDDDGKFDWPRLGSLVQTELVCVDDRTNLTVRELAAMTEELERPRVAFVRDDRVAVVDRPASDLEAPLKRRDDDLDWCYRSESGEEVRPIDLTVRALVSPEGKVVRAEVVDSARSSPQFDECVTDVVSSLTLPAVDAGWATVDSQLSFQP